MARATAPAPSGLGLDSEGIRRRMVDRVRKGGVGDEAILDVLARVPRHHFVDSALANQAYEDLSLPIGLGQTISRPSVVARMLALLRSGREASGLGRVLEVGTGCGYQAALLSLLARQVVSVERLRTLHEKAKAHLPAHAYHNVRLVHADGMRGHPPNAPYDSIIAACCGDELPAPWLAQLAEGGRLVAPVVRGGGQVLVVVDRVGEQLQRRELDAVQFVPLKSGSA